MLRFLFRGLTAEPSRGAALFDAVTAKARQPGWYIEGNVPDTVDGRFAVLSTVAALVIVRLERNESEGNPTSVALTERFIEVMESEHRELGLGDPTLGRTVRKLVSLLAKRTEIWRSATAGKTGWDEAVQKSLYKDGADPDALRHSAGSLHVIWNGLEGVSLAELEEGKLA